MMEPETDRDKATSTTETRTIERDTLHAPFILSNTPLTVSSLSTGYQRSPFIFLIPTLNNHVAHKDINTTSRSSKSIQILPASPLQLSRPHRQLTTEISNGSLHSKMCHLSIFWHNCDHLIPMTLTCPFQDLPSHTTEPTSTALLGDPCPLCRQQYPLNKQTLTTHQSLLTAQTLASILNASVAQPGFLDMVARFFARGDHKRFDQPGPEKSVYDQSDEYLDSLAEESRLAVQTLSLNLDLDDLCDLPPAPNSDPEAQDGHEESNMPTPMATALASWDGLNWEGRNEHPSAGFYYYSTGSGPKTGTEQAHTPTPASQQLLAAGGASDIAAHEGDGDGKPAWNGARDQLQAVTDGVPYTPIPVTLPIHGSTCALAGSESNRRGESMDASSPQAPCKRYEMPRAILVRRITQRRNGKKRQEMVSIGKSPLARGEHHRKRDKREE
jgi:hypothetical protein